MATVAVTPENDIWMAGYASRNRPADGKETELYAKALVLEDIHGTRLESSDKLLVSHARRFLARLDAGEQLPPSYPCPVQFIRFGDDLVLAALGGETVIDYSLRLKRELAGDGPAALGELRTTAVTGQEESSINVWTLTTAVPVHGIVRRCRLPHRPSLKRLAAFCILNLPDVEVESLSNFAARIVNLFDDGVNFLFHR